jgi:hypothetical protein
VPDIPQYETRTVIQDYQKLKVYRGKILLFGASDKFSADSVAFNGNTVFGNDSEEYVSTTITAVTDINFNEFIGNTAGTTVASSIDTVDSLWYNTSGNFANWTKVRNVTFEGTAATDVTNKGKFLALGYGNVLGSNKFLAIRDFGNNLNEITSSTNGIDWIEHGTGLNDFDTQTTAHILQTNSGWLSNNFFKSDNGINWIELTALKTQSESLGIAAVANKVVGGADPVLFKFATASYGSNNTGAGVVWACNAALTNFILARPGYEFSTSLLFYRLKGAAFNGSNQYLFSVMRSSDGFNFSPYIAVRNGTMYSASAGDGSTGFYTYYKVQGVDQTSIGDLHYNVSVGKYFLNTPGRIYIVSLENAINGILAPGQGLTLVSSQATSALKFSSSGNATFNTDASGNLLYGIGSNAWVAKSTDFNATYNNVAVAYKTNYCYPGVAGTTTITRSGNFGIGSTGFCPQYHIDWSTPLP